MPSLDLTSPNGWNRWIFVRSSVDSVQLADAPFPPDYIPSSGFWLRGIINNCVIPWLNTFDSLTTFLVAGGSSGTVLGSVSGLSAVGSTFGVSVANQTFGIGRSAPAPEMGFCIGDLFKQHVYTRMDIQNNQGFVIATNVMVELLQNSRLKRIYINQGEVLGYRRSGGENLLTLDIYQNDPPMFSAGGEQLKITTENGISYTVNVLEIKSNWEVSISDPGDNVPKNGDFYQLNTTWCIEDPFLLSGNWFGSENDSWATSNKDANSGLGLFITSHISPYEEGRFLGVYIWKEYSKITTTTTTTTTLASSTTTPTTTTPTTTTPTTTTPTTTTTTTTPVVTLPQQPSYNVTMQNSGVYGWAFLDLGNDEYSDIYPDDKRYVEVILDRPDEDGATVKYDQRDEASVQDYDELLWNESTEYIRVEISSGGYRTRHNWYAPILKGSYLKCDNKYYKILNHVEANIIDVAIKAVDGITIFNPLMSQNYSIVNQYGWMISEHYDGYVDGSHEGVFKGEIESVVYDTTTDETSFNLNVYKDSYVSWAINNAFTPPDIDNNLISRYRDTHQHAIGEPLKDYLKYQDWIFVTDNGNEKYLISNIVFTESQPSTFGESYVVSVGVVGNISSFSGKDGYVIFDNDFETKGSFSKESGYSYSATVSAGADKLSGFVSSDTLCLDGEYRSNPYVLNVSENSRIGYCEGLYFGIDANGSAQSQIGELLLITTPFVSGGTTSLFHALREEDWIFYKDSVTGKMTIRRGSLDFKEYPMKTEISIGQSNLTENATVSSSSVVTLNTNEDRLKRLLIKVPSMVTGEKPELLFGIGSKDSVHGFIVEGDGVVDLQMLRRQGVVRNELPSSTYQDSSGNFISPVYIYKRDGYQNLDDLIVDVGMDTDNGPIFINNGRVHSVKAQYVNSNQTIDVEGVIDAHQLIDGEIIIFYNKLNSAFSITHGMYEFLNNSSDNGTEWSNRNSIMCSGTFDNFFEWGTPFRKSFQNEDDQYPMMILNSVEYLCSLYNPLSNEMAIFSRCFDGNSDYVGCFIVSVLSFLYKKQKCISENSAELDFLWRSPLLTDAFITDKNKSWTSSSNIINDGYSFVESPVIKEDEFYRILGPSVTNSQCVYIGEVGTPSVSILSDGTYVFFYDTADGIKALYSNDDGRRWVGSDLVYARNARSGMLIGSYLLYIAEYGIEFKRTNEAVFSSGKIISMKKGEGESVGFLEGNMQNDLDRIDHFLIGSGQIEYQRLSGYLTLEGFLKVFYYNNSNILVCMESFDTYIWSFADNF